MEVVQTNASLGYGQLAYLIKLLNDEDGSNYLCIGKNFDGDSIKVGDVLTGLPDYYIEKSNFNIEKSELSGTYLFEFWKAHSSSTCLKKNFSNN